MYQVSQNLFDYFTVSAGNDAFPPVRLRHCGDLIRFHILGLADNGDLSVCAKARFWQAFVAKQGRQLRGATDDLLPDEEARQALLEQAGKWSFQIKELTPLPVGRYTMNFQRRPIIEHVLKTVLSQAADYGRRSKTDQSPTLSLMLQNAGTGAGGEGSGSGSGSQELRHYRLQVIYDIMRRLAEYSPWRLVEPEDQTKDTLRVCVELQKCSQRELKDHVCLVSGPVVEPVQKTATKMTVDTYLE